MILSGQPRGFFLVLVGALWWRQFVRTRPFVHLVNVVRRGREFGKIGRVQSGQAAPPEPFSFFVRRAPIELHIIRGRTRGDTDKAIRPRGLHSLLMSKHDGFLLSRVVVAIQVARARWGRR